MIEEGNKLKITERLDLAWRLIVISLFLIILWMFSIGYATINDIPKTIKEDYKFMFKLLKTLFKGVVFGKI